MRMYQEEQERETSTAAGERVTPEELARAASALEAKREEERQRHSDTIPLGEAVQQLDLNVTAEELLAEVEALRAARVKELKQSSQKLSNRAGNILGICIFVAGLLGVGLFLFHEGALHDAVHTLSVIPLSQAANGQTVRCDLQTVIRLAANAADPTKVLVDTRPESAEDGEFNNEWTLIPNKGHYTVRGWATADQALRAKNEQSATVFSNRPSWLSASNLVEVEVPVNRFADLPSDQFTEYDEKGAKAAAATSVVEGVVTNGVDDLIINLIEIGEWDYSDHIYVSVGSGSVLLKGVVDSEAKKQRATRLTVEALGKLGLTDRVVNELTVK